MIVFTDGVDSAPINCDRKNEHQKMISVVAAETKCQPSQFLSHCVTELHNLLVLLPASACCGRFKDGQ